MARRDSVLIDGIGTPGESVIAKDTFQVHYVPVRHAVQPRWDEISYTGRVVMVVVVVVEVPE